MRRRGLSRRALPLIPPAAWRPHPPRPAPPPADAGAADPTRRAAARRRPPRTRHGRPAAQVRFARVPEVVSTAVSACSGASSLAGGRRLPGSFSGVSSGSSVHSASASLRSCAQLLEAAADLAALLGLVAAHGVEALEVEGGQAGRPAPTGSRPAAGGAWGRRRTGRPRSARRARPSRRRSRGGARSGPRSRSWAPTSAIRRAVISSSSDGRLVLEDQVVHGGEAVLEGVARGAGLAFLGDGSARAGAVAAGGLDLGGGAGMWGGWHGGIRRLGGGGSG